jgi:transcription initiation factor TFIID subunit 10
LDPFRHTQSLQPLPFSDQTKLTWGKKRNKSGRTSNDLPTMTEPLPSQPANGSQEQQRSSIPPSSAQPQSSIETADTTIKPEPDLDASIEQDIDMNADQTGAGAEESAAGAEVDQLAESAQPSKKETSLREFLGKMDEYAPIVSDP